MSDPAAPAAAPASFYNTLVLALIPAAFGLISEEVAWYHGAALTLVTLGLGALTVARAATDRRKTEAA